MPEVPGHSDKPVWPSGRGDQLVTASVADREVARPFLGVTVTVILHDPGLIPFTDVPLTLQTFDELVATFRATFEPAGSDIPRYRAIETPVAAFFGVITGAVFAGTVVDGTTVVAGVVAAVVSGAARREGGSGG